MKYSFDEYNEYHVLKIPLTLIIVNLYALKHLFMLMMPALALVPKVGNSLQQTMPLLTEFAHHHSGWLFFLISVPAATVLFMMQKRTPQARPWIRHWWKRSHWLLAITLVLEMLLMTGGVLLGRVEFNELALVVLYLDAMCLLYLYRSTRLRDVLAEFPESVEKKTAA